MPFIRCIPIPVRNIAFLLFLLLGAQTLQADSVLADAGRKQFIRCSGCHVLTSEPLPATAWVSDAGPHLHGIIDRPARAVEGFPYTDEMPAADFIWTEEQLDRWLEQPQQMFPGVCMPFMGMSNPQARKALIEYMRQSAAD